MAPALSNTNGVLSPAQSVQSAAPQLPRVILGGNSARILCVADIRGDYHELNRLIREHEATAVIHTGDFGFLNADSLERMGDKILRHLLQYSPLIAPATRNQLLSIPPQAGRAAIISELSNLSVHFPLSQFPLLLSGSITFPVPVFTVWGLIEDVRIVEKFRTGEYEVNNLTVIDEASSALIETAGLKLRLFGLGGAVAMHKMFDNGEGLATIAGGQGTMWTTALQLGELIETAQRVYDPTETRVLITSAPISRFGLLSLLSLAVKADLTISCGLHFRYPASLNDFAVHGDFDSYRAKLAAARDSFLGVYDVVKERVEASLNEHQQVLLKKVITMVHKSPSTEDNTWTNTWHWVLADAMYGHLLLAINDGRVSAEMRSNGLNFAHRANQTQQAPSVSLHPGSATVSQPVRPTVGDSASGVPPKPVGAPAAAAASKQPVPAKPIGAPVKPVAPVAKPLPGQHQLPARGPRGAPNAFSGPPAPVAKPESRKERVASPGPKGSKQGTPTTTATALPKELKRGDKTDGNESEAPKSTPPPKRFSLYVKGLPIPTTEPEVRGLFGSAAEKITGVKLVFDQKQVQKNFCYVDFANETDMHDVLKLHSSGTIRDAPISIELSNPPARNVSAALGDRGDRGGRGSRAGRRLARGGSASSKDAFKPDSKSDGDSKPESKSESKPDTPKPEVQAKKTEK